MINNLLKYGLLFIGLTILQIFVLNGINFLRYATPFIYIYFLIKLPVGISRNLLLFLGFVLGFVIDVFCNTPGINAGASVLAAFLRPYLIKSLATLDVAENREPSLYLFGLQPFLRYIAVMILIHHAALLLLESFSLFNWQILLLRIPACSLFTFVLIWAAEGLTGNQRKR
ncbi:MAG: rod shape-determining protein MreD [Candidatus Azobacteroides sp.]|nr:rod shape-determining protein MreD [Candidatus Azobacteroides sp.]